MANEGAIAHLKVIKKKVDNGLLTQQEAVHQSIDLLMHIFGTTYIADNSPLTPAVKTVAEYESLTIDAIIKAAKEL